MSRIDFDLTERERFEVWLEPNQWLISAQADLGAAAAALGPGGPLGAAPVTLYTTEFCKGALSLSPAEVRAHARAAKESEIPNFKGSFLGRFPLVLADFWTSDHLSERSRSVDAFSGTRARGTLTLKRT